MPTFAIAFLLGDLYIQTLPTIPLKSTLLILLTATIITTICLINKTRYHLIPVAFTLGIIWTSLFATWNLNWYIPSEIENQPITITGFITSLPEQTEWGDSFLFNLKSITTNNQLTPLNQTIKLSTSTFNPSYHVGDEWQFNAKLKAIHGTQSPGAFDYEAWALANHIQAQGAIQKSGAVKLSSHPYRYPLNHLREMIKEKMKSVLPKTHSAKWLYAFTIGERSSLNQDEWTILRVTGTNHLIAVAGLHIALLASIFFFITKWLCTRSSRLSLYIPVNYLAATVGMLAAILYAGIAGLTAPTERAVLMTIVATLLLLSNRRINPWYAFTFVLMLVLIINPLIVLLMSFWLSFTTIAIIIYGLHGRLHPVGLWWKYGRLQWVLTIGLLPLTLYYFQGFSLIAWLANVIVVPWFCILVLPFCLFGVILLPLSLTLSHYLFLIADKQYEWIWQTLTLLSHTHGVMIQYAVPTFTLVVLLYLAVIAIIAPIGMPGRWLAIIWLLPLIYYPQHDIPNGAIKASILDVGQGLAIVVQTKRHTLLFDAGPRRSANADSGESIVLPFLRLNHINKLDTAIISHGDNDHVGGIQAIMKNMTIERLYASSSKGLNAATFSQCQSGQHWQWDEVDFMFLSPSLNERGGKNNRSCVLKIVAGNKSMLLPGDIESKAEEALVYRSPAALVSSIIIAPHHGSKTSIYPDFLRAVSPQWAIYSTGYLNKYHFPHNETVSAYQHLQVNALNTAYTGTIDIDISNNEIKLSSYRMKHKKYWL